MFKSRLFLCCLCDPGQVNLTDNLFFRRGNTCSTYLTAASMLSLNAEAAAKGSLVILPPSCPQPPVQPKTERVGDPPVGPSRRSVKDANLIALPWGRRRRAPRHPPPPQRQATIPARLQGPSPSVSQVRPAPATSDPPGASFAPWWRVDPSPRGVHRLASARLQLHSGWGQTPIGFVPGSLESPAPQVRRERGGREVAAYRGA